MKKGLHQLKHLETRDTYLDYIFKRTNYERFISVKIIKMINLKGKGEVGQFSHQKPPNYPVNTKF